MRIENHQLIFFLERYININGRLLPAGEASVAPDSRAFRYGYGLFETMLVRENVTQLASLHWKRLFEGLTQLRFLLTPHFTPDYLAQEVTRSVKRNNLERLCRVRLQVYAGSGGLYAAQPKPEFIIECFPLDETIISLNENGLVAGIAQGLAKSVDSLSHLKSCNALIYALAARQAADEKWNDALILNTEGRIIESTIANIFWIKDNIIYTPPLEEGCVAGIMRQHLWDVIPQLGFIVRHCPLSKSIVENADEVFITNAIRNIKWIKEINRKTYRSDRIREICSGLAKV